jgi:hypothetical protein
MKWFDKWFARKWRWAYDNRDEIELVTLSGSGKPSRVIQKMSLGKMAYASPSRK